jgi:prepilin-type N-terminal cleavage/methylation domain-containing protein
MNSSTLGRLRGRCERRLGGQRGFTLLELMTVVVIVSALAVVTIPQITRRMKDRRAQQAAQMVANFYRNARMRAMGRGGAVLVRFTAANSGRIDVREGIQGPASSTCPGMPLSSCNLVDWNLATNYSEVTFFAPASLALYDRVVLQATSDPLAGGTANIGQMDVCFSPLGHTYVRYGFNDAWTPLTGVPVIAVFRQSPSGDPIGLRRNVLLLPNGAARLGVATPGSGV